MDRSFLSDAKVVAALHSFVCIRLATYEDKDELQVLERVFVGRSGQVENTVFAVLGPDGEKSLTRSGRSPHAEWRDADAMAKGLTAIASRYQLRRGPAATSEAGLLGVPYVKSVRLGLNVAEADATLLVVVFGSTADQRTAIETTLAGAIWNAELRGRFTFARAAAIDELAAIGKATMKPGLLIVQPDPFGLRGNQLAHLALGADQKSVTALLQTLASKNHVGSKDAREQIRLGRTLGVHWKTETPVTDPHQPGTERRQPPEGRRRR